VSLSVGAAHSREDVMLGKSSLSVSQTLRMLSSLFLLRQPMIKILKEINQDSRKVCDLRITNGSFFNAFEVGTHCVAFLFSVVSSISLEGRLGSLLSINFVLGYLSVSV